MVLLVLAERGSGSSACVATTCVEGGGGRQEEQQAAGVSDLVAGGRMVCAARCRRSCFFVTSDY